MNVLKKYRLKKQQKALMQKREIYERLQTEHNDDEFFQKYIQHEMDALNDKAEFIREILEGRWND